MKKTMFAVAATAAVTSFFGFNSETEASAATHKVSSGDSLWKIANTYGTSVNNLKSLNNLSSDLIHPNQVLKVTGSASAPSTSSPAPSASGSSSATYTVKSGDTLGAIARANNLTLSKLMELNSISGHLIFPGQKLKLGGDAPQTSAPPTSAPSASQPGSSSSTYVVRSGDTLGKIALNNKTTVANLKSWNKLSSDLIFVGQKLSVTSSGGSNNVSAPPTSSPSQSNSSVINIAMNQLGVPYSWGGSSPAGFDCSGFIYYVYKQAGLDISRTSAEGFHARSYEVKSPSVGDLVFFENTYKSGISHVGIYVGDNKFIHANDAGVQITSLDNSYWKSKFESFKSFY